MPVRDEQVVIWAVRGRKKRSISCKITERLLPASSGRGAPRRLYDKEGVNAPWVNRRAPDKETGEMVPGVRVVNLSADPAYKDWI
jgi:hypothetical protein